MSAPSSVVCAMSGGVDSSAAALLLKNSGYVCAGITMKLFENESRCCSLSDVNDARDVCNKLSIPHYVVNFKNEFQKNVIDKFVTTYKNGATPNPCIDCNRYIKFNLLLLRTFEINFNLLATGHYARIEKSGARYILKKAKDTLKDQSYVLYTLTQEQLSKTLFPLGNYTKTEIREIALQNNLINAKKKDSQDICFVPDGNFGKFIDNYTGCFENTGNILDVNGKKTGVHKGHYHYTIGQRRGLGFSSGGRLYVTGKSPAENTITLGPESALYSKTLLAKSLNLIAFEKLDKPLKVKIKTRYMQKESEALLTQIDEDTIRADFAEAERAVTPGQAAVFYDGDVVLGGGTIV